MKFSALLILLPFAQCSLRGLSNSLRSLSIGTRFGARTASAHQILSERDVPFEDIGPRRFQNGPALFSKHFHPGGASWPGLNRDAEKPAPEEILVEKIHTEPEKVPIASIDTSHLLQSNHVKPPQDSSVVSPHTARFPPIILRPLTPGRKKFVLGLDQTILDENIVLDYFTDKIIREFVQERLKMSEYYAQSYVRDLIQQHGSILKGLSKENRPELIGYEKYLNEKLAYGKSHYHRNIKAVLERVDADIVLFTDFSGEHARKVLEDLGLLPYFHMIIAADPENPDCPVKPSYKAMDRVSEALMVEDKRIYYIEDNDDQAKIAYGYGCGWNTVVFGESHQLRFVHGATEMFQFLRDVFPSLPIVA